jgi:hypothetical protein
MHGVAFGTTEHLRVDGRTKLNGRTALTLIAFVEEDAHQHDGHTTHRSFGRHESPRVTKDSWKLRYEGTALLRAGRQ